MADVTLPVVACDYLSPRGRTQVTSFDCDSHIFANRGVREVDGPREAVRAVLRRQGRRMPAEQAGPVVLPGGDEVGQVGVRERALVDYLTEAAGHLAALDAVRNESAELAAVDDRSAGLRRAAVLDDSGLRAIGHATSASWGVLSVEEEVGGSVSDGKSSSSRTSARCIHPVCGFSAAVYCCARCSDAARSSPSKSNWTYVPPGQRSASLLIARSILVAHGRSECVASARFCSATFAYVSESPVGASITHAGTRKQRATSRADNSRCWRNCESSAEKPTGVNLMSPLTTATLCMLATPPWRFCHVS